MSSAAGRPFRTWNALAAGHLQRHLTHSARQDAFASGVHRAVQHSKKVGGQPFSQATARVHKHHLSGWQRQGSRDGMGEVGWERRERGGVGRFRCADVERQTWVGQRAWHAHAPATPPLQQHADAHAHICSSQLLPPRTSPHLVHARRHADLQRLALPHPLAVLGCCVLPRRAAHHHPHRRRRPRRQRADVHKYVGCCCRRGAAWRRRLLAVGSVHPVCGHLMLCAPWPGDQHSELELAAGIASGGAVAPHCRPHGSQHPRPQLGGVDHRRGRRRQRGGRAAAGAASCCRCCRCICFHHQPGAAGQAVDVEAQLKDGGAAHGAGGGVGACAAWMEGATTCTAVDAWAPDPLQPSQHCMLQRAAGQERTHTVSLTSRRGLQERPRGYGAWHRRLVADQEHGALLLLRGLLRGLRLLRLLLSGVGECGGGCGRRCRRCLLPALGCRRLLPESCAAARQSGQGQEGPGGWPGHEHKLVAAEAGCWQWLDAVLITCRLCRDCETGAGRPDGAILACMGLPPGLVHFCRGHTPHTIQATPSQAHTCNKLDERRGERKERQALPGRPVVGHDRR